MKRHRLFPCALILVGTAAPLSAQIGIADTPVSRGPAKAVVWSVAAHPTDPLEILVTRQSLVNEVGSSLLRSLDGGASFFPQAGSDQVKDLVRDPQHPDWLYGRRYEGSTYEVAHSTDFGRTWSSLTAPDLYCRGIRTPLVGSHVLTFGSDFLQRSTDGGATWEGIPLAAPFTDQVLDVRYAPSDPSTIYMYGRYASFPSQFQLYRSSDAGVTFAPVWVGPSPLGVDPFIAVHPLSASIVILGDRQFGDLWRSTDGGQNFTHIDTPFPTPWAAEWEPNGVYLWVFEYDRSWYSTDDGDTWTELSLCIGDWGPYVPFGQSAIRRISYDQSGNRYFPASECGEVYRMPTGPVSTWQPLGIPGRSIQDLVVLAPGGDRLCLPTYDPVHIAAPGALFTELDAGAGSVVADAGLAVDPDDPTRWLTGINYIPPFSCDLSGCTYILETYVHTGSGAQVTPATTAQSLYAGLGISVEYVFDPQDPDRVVQLASGGPSVQAATSLDRGLSWTPAITADPTLGVVPRPPGCLAFDPFRPGRVLALGELWPTQPGAAALAWVESFDSGLTWSSPQVLWPLGDPASGEYTRAAFLHFDPYVEDLLFAGDTEVGLRRSTDGGLTWDELGVSLGPRSELLLHPQMPGLLWVTDANGQILVSGKYGIQFTPASASQGALRAGPLALDTADGSLLFGTEQNSAWELERASPYVAFGLGTPGSGGFVPRHYPLGHLPAAGNGSWALAGEDIPGAGTVLPMVGFGELPIGVFGGTWQVDLFTLPWLQLPIATSDGSPGVPGEGAFYAPLALPANPNLVGVQLISQCLVIDPGAADPSGIALTNALRTMVLP